MQVLLFNGSPREKGNTFHCLQRVEEQLREEGFGTNLIQVGTMNLKGCTGCGGCFKMKNFSCVIRDELNELISQVRGADGFVFGSPVYYGGMSPQIKAFMDRLFYVSGANGNFFYHKVGTTLAAVRRSGGSSTCDAMNRYILYAEMLVPTGNYWNIIHGARPGEVLEDVEGMQTLRRLSLNMAWLLKLVDHGRRMIPEPEREPKTPMNFIRPQG